MDLRKNIDKFSSSPHRIKLLTLLAISGTVALIVIVRKNNHGSRARTKGSGYGSSGSASRDHVYSSPDPPRKQNILSAPRPGHSSGEWSFQSLYQRSRPSRGQRAKDFARRVRHRCYIHRLDLLFLVVLIGLGLYAYDLTERRYQEQQYSSYNPLYYYPQQQEGWLS